VIIGHPQSANKQKSRSHASGFCFASPLFLHVGQKAHEASALYGGFDLALLFGGEVRAIATHDAAVRVDELLQEIHVFVVDVLNVILRKDVVHNILLLDTCDLLLF
jgi:hypothetical protein